MSETERAAWIIKRTQELTAQGLGWSKAMAQARAEAERAGLYRAVLKQLDGLLRRTLNEPLAHDMIRDIQVALSDAGEQLADAERLLVLARLGQDEEP